MQSDYLQKISILIPTYNRADLLKNAIDSSLAQSYKCEIIVCDHGSTDNTKELCESYGQKIKYIYREKDYGIHFCELEALMASSGEFIHFCFDDDWMHPRYIEESIKLLSNDVGIVFSNYEIISLNKDWKRKLKWFEYKHIKSVKKYSIFKIPNVLRGLISPSCALIRRKDAIRCIYMDTNLMSDSYYKGVGPDWLMTAFPLFKYRKYGHIQNTLIRFGDHSDSITVDALNSNSQKKDKFNKAYIGARIYLVVSQLIKTFQIEKIIFFIFKNIYEKIIPLIFKIKRFLKDPK